MKKTILSIFIASACVTTYAQNRKYVSSFSVFSQYYNPAFTGFDGSSVKSYYRDQWTGFDGAPKTVFISGEVNLDDYLTTGEQSPGEQVVKNGIRHAVGVYVLHDTYGPFAENQVYGTYRSGVNLTENLRLQAGAAIGYHSQKLNGNRLTAEDLGDPLMQKYSGLTSRAGRINMNLGLVLAGEDFYAGYAMQNIMGKLGGNETVFVGENNTVQYVLQGGYRKAVSDQVGVAVNGLFRYDTQQKETLEGQVKGVFYNTAWLGLGYRNSLAYTFSVGFRMKQVSMGYVYETPVGNSQMNGSTSEILLRYDLLKVVHPRLGRKMTMW